MNSGSSVLMAFDLLYFDGHDLTKTELSTRRHLLESLIAAGSVGAIRLSEEAGDDGEALFQAAFDHGLEGIIAKRLDSTYQSGRFGDWLKIKRVQSDSFMGRVREPAARSVSRR